MSLTLTREQLWLKVETLLNPEEEGTMRGETPEFCVGGRSAGGIVKVSVIILAIEDA